MRLRYPTSRPTRWLHPANVRHEGDDRMLGEIVADGVSATIGSWPFILIQSSVLGLWLLANGVLIGRWLAGSPFDPFPFILLNLVLSFQAAYTGPVVMMSQNRQSAKDRDAAEHDYAVNQEALRLLQQLTEGHVRLEHRLAAIGGGPPTTDPGLGA